MFSPHILNSLLPAALLSAAHSLFSVWPEVKCIIYFHNILQHFAFLCEVVSQLSLYLRLKEVVFHAVLSKNSVKICKSLLYILMPVLLQRLFLLTSSLQSFCSVGPSYAKGEMHFCSIYRLWLHSSDPEKDTDILWDKRVRWQIAYSKYLNPHSAPHALQRSSIQNKLRLQFPSKVSRRGTWYQTSVSSHDSGQYLLRLQCAWNGANNSLFTSVVKTVHWLKGKFFSDTTSYTNAN